jgi:tRNA(Ile)-lysidine synthase
VSAESDGVVVRFTAAAPDHAGEDADVPVSFEYELKCPGRTSVPEADFVISARCDQVGRGGVETNTSRTTLELAVDAASVKWPLSVRNRRPGDRIKPVGGSGRKKVQDLLVDIKMPRADRERVAVVVDANGQLVWVVGVTPADQYGARVPGAEMVVLRAERR